MGKKERLWGPPKGGMENWRGAVVVPGKMADALLEKLTVLKEAGEIGPIHFKRQGGLWERLTGTGKCIVWAGTAPKSARPLCGARTRKGTLCKAKAIYDKDRCRMHGGLSTGPKTAEGRARIAESNRRRAEANRRAKMATL